MIILNPGSGHDKLDYSDYKSGSAAVDGISNNPAVLS